MNKDLTTKNTKDTKNKAYPKYKPSGVEWLGDVPEHWGVKRLKHLVMLKSGEGITVDDIEESGEYPVYGGNGFRGYAINFTHDGHFVLIGRQGALCGNINYAKGKFWASEHAVVATPWKPLATIWLGELLRLMNLNQYSISAAQPGLAIDRIKELHLPVPSLSEQQAISAFLDLETGRIDALIAKKQRLLELLAEQRTALISHAVTRGLDATVKLKPSGVEWLGNVPEHWGIKRFSREVYIQEGQVDPEKEPFLSMYLIGPEHIESRTGKIIKKETAQEQSAESGKYFCKQGNVLYSKIRPALCKVSVADEDCICSADMYPLRSRGQLDHKYLFWYMLSDRYTAWSVLEADRVAMPKINRETLKSAKIPIPPLHEQQAIAAFLDSETAKIDALSTKVSTVIERLKEYRTALISSAVTGKINVQEAV